MTKHLIKKGINLKAVDEDGKNALHYAVGNNSDLYDLLIEKGIDLKAADKFGKTALHYAAAQHNFAMCKLLIKKGADANAEDKDGKTPLHCSLYKNQEVFHCSETSKKKNE